MSIGLFTKTTILIVLTNLPLVAGAQIYKCDDEFGRPQYSDKPCADDAEVVEVDTSSTGISLGSQGDYSKIKADNDERDTIREIAKLEKDITSLESRRDGELAAIERKRKRANNNLAGATWLQSLTTEKQAVSDNYNSQIQGKRAEVNRLRDTLND